MLKWIRNQLTKRNESSSEWYLVADGKRLALLRSPIAEDMFWISFEIVPLTEPVDSRLTDDSFWTSETWEVIDARTHELAPNVIASSSGINRAGNRVTLRGLR